MTGNGVSGSISVELAPSRPTTCRANSDTATCMPRQMPRYGIRARARPGRRGSSPPSRASRSRRGRARRRRRRASPRVSSYDMFSASSQRTCTRAAVVQARVLQRLVHGEVRVLELHVLADERDLDELALLVDALRRARPTRRGRPRALEAELLADEPVETLAPAAPRHEVDVGDVGARDDRARVDVGEERDLVADVARELLVRAADDDVGMDTDAAQLVHRVLRRLRLQLAGRLDERHERHVDVHRRSRARPRAGTGGSPRGTAATRCRPPCRRSPR